MGDVSIWAISLLGVVVKAYILCVFFSRSDYVALWDSQTPHRPAGERVSWCLETSPPSRLPPCDRSLSLTLVSLFVFYILSYLLSNRMDCLSGCLVSSTSVQKWFCGSCSAFKWSFDEFGGEKVVFSSYSSAILGPPPPLFDLSITSVFSPHPFRMSLHGWFPDLSSNKRSSGPNKNVSFI